MATDSFTATNNPLASPWTAVVPAGAIESTGGEARKAGASAGAMVYGTSTELYSEVVMSDREGGGGADDNGPALWDPATGNGYIAVITGAVFLLRYAGFAYDTDSNTAGTAVNGDRLAIFVDNNDVVVAKNDVEILRRVNDTTYRAGLQPGLYCNNASGALDDWTDGVAPVPPVFSGTIPDVTVDEDTGTHSYGLGAYFTGATSYSIAPAIETGWTFNTVTGELVIDTDDAGVFGPFVVTGTNADGSDDSNGFSVTVTATPPEPPTEPSAGGDDAWKYQGPSPKQKDYRPELDEKRLRERAELRETLERAAGLIVEAEEAAGEAERPAFTEQVSALRTEFTALRDEIDSAAELKAAQARVDLLIATASDAIVLQIADVLTDLIQEIADDDF